METDARKAVLWDMDGTLVDSLGYHWVAWRDVTAAAGLVVTHERFLSTLGKQNNEILVEWFGDRLMPAERVRIGLDKEVHYRELVRSHGIQPLPGVLAWLERLRDDGWVQAVATAAPRLNDEAVMDALGLAAWFEVRVVAEDVARGKPFPDVFLKAAERLSVPPAQAIVIEDAPGGVQAGRAAGVKTIGVSARSLTEADVWVPSLEVLPRDTFDRLLAEASGA